MLVSGAGGAAALEGSLRYFANPGPVSSKLLVMAVSQATTTMSPPWCPARPHSSNYIDHYLDVARA